MNESKSTSESSLIKNNIVVDCDVHTSETHESDSIARDVAVHMDEPHRSRLHPDEPGVPAYPNPGYGVSIPGKLEPSWMSVTDPEKDIQQKLCQDFGVDYPIINTTGMLDMLIEDEHAVQEMRGINNMLLNRFLDEYDHFHGLITIATRKPDKAAEEIDRLGDEDSVVGIYLNPGGQERALGDPRYDPIYQAAEDHDLPVVYHSIAGGMMWESPGIFRGLQKFMSLHTLGHAVVMMLTLTSLITQGTPEKFPDLDFVILEAGVGWIPYMMFRLNREWGQRRSEAPLLQKTPEAYIRDQFYFGTQPLGEPIDDSQLQQLIDVVGTDSLLFATDHPHYDFDNPSAVDTYFQHLPETKQEKILSRNAVDVFDLDI